MTAIEGTPPPMKADPDTLMRLCDELERVASAMRSADPYSSQYVAWAELANSIADSMEAEAALILAAEPSLMKKHGDVLARTIAVARTLLAPYRRH